MAIASPASGERNAPGREVNVARARRPRVRAHFAHFAHFDLAYFALDNYSDLTGAADALHHRPPADLGCRSNS